MAAKRPRAAFEKDLQKQESPFVRYGTPLPPLDEQKRDDGSYVPVWKQEVTDDRGRKRLHGAFTGGFSAGYFNTVGSKEGWTPATFKSSRQNRIQKPRENISQRPEDFMDEEDLREAEESREISTDAVYSGFGSTGDDPRRREALQDIFRPAEETVGVRLLKKMGWKEGQGIGPKVRRVANTDKNQSMEPPVTHFFAPPDPPMISFTPHTGYQGLDLDSDSANRGPSQIAQNTADSDDEPKMILAYNKGMSKGKLQNAKKGAFGVGILNDTGSDDEDPYQLGPQISYNRVMGEDKMIQKKKKQKQRIGLEKASDPLPKKRPLVIPSKDKTRTTFQTCHDGRPPLHGFVLSTELDSFSMMTLQDERYQPLKVPDGWVSQKTSSTSVNQENYVSTAEAAKASKLDAKGRAQLLGEEQLPAKSVYDFLSPGTRDRIAEASGKKDLPKGLGEKPPEGFETRQAGHNPSPQRSVPILEASIAKQALTRGSGGWMPYAEDLGKRARYRLFLGYHAGEGKEVPQAGKEMSSDDWINEQNEFVRAAQVFKPVTGMMASRFVSSSDPKPSTGSDSQSASTSLPSRPEDPALNAAKMGMFGPLTRSVKNFYPTRLLCKRFNVKPPVNAQPASEGSQDVHGSNNATSSTPSPAYQSAMAPSNQNMNTTAMVLAKSPLDQNPSSVRPENPEASGSGHPESTETGGDKEPVYGERPSDDVFKAIFGSDDDEDSE